MLQETRLLVVHFICYDDNAKCSDAEMIANLKVYFFAPAANTFNFNHKIRVNF
jgi:hypothetical protein